jgi:hypothetical protein
MESLHNILRDVYDSVDCSAGEDCTDLSKVGADCVACATGQYFDGRHVDYSCEQRRQIYLLRYLHVHLQEVYNAFRGVCQYPTFPKWQGKAKVLSIGGGPGSDIAGFQRFVTELGSVLGLGTEFEITRLERVAEWNNLASLVFPLFSAEGYIFEHITVHSDISEFKPLNSAKYQIIMMSYVISELDEENLKILEATIKNAMAPNAVLIINDRNEKAVIEKIRLLLSKVKLLEQWCSVEEEWCGIFYPDDLRDVVKPKVYMKSLRFGAVVDCP